MLYWSTMLDKKGSENQKKTEKLGFQPNIPEQSDLQKYEMLRKLSLLGFLIWVRVGKLILE